MKPAIKKGDSGQSLSEGDRILLSGYAHILYAIGRDGRNVGVSDSDIRELRRIYLTITPRSVSMSCNGFRCLQIICSRLYDELQK